MEVLNCKGCLQRDAIIGGLQTRVAELEAAFAQQQQSIQRLQAYVRRLSERLASSEPDMRREAADRESDAERPAPSYSLDAERKRRQRRRRRQRSRGRRPTEVKFADTARQENLYPDGVCRGVCRLVRERAVWRLEDGRAVLVGYRIFAGPDGHEPRIPGVTPHCEYGIEILVVLAFLVYIIGISLDKACAVLGFFCQLPLSKSQADALLRQLARHWEGEFNLLCALIAHAAVVYLDETSWKMGGDGCSLWAFASTMQRVFLFGCHKDDATLDQMLPPEVFGGVGVSAGAQNRPPRGAVKLGHFEEQTVRYFASIAVPTTRGASWRINSKWPSSTPSSRCIGRTGPSGGLPRRWASTAIPSPGICAVDGG